jgi:hypothetical protein
MTDDEVKEKLLALKKMAEDMARYAQSLINEIDLKKRSKK